MENFSEIAANLRDNIDNYKNNIYTFRFNLKTLQARMDEFKQKLADSTDRFHQSIAKAPATELKPRELRKAS